MIVGYSAHRTFAEKLELKRNTDEASSRKTTFPFIVDSANGCPNLISEPSWLPSTLSKKGFVNIVETVEKLLF